MNSEINISNSLSIGIDSNIIGAGIGCILNKNTRIFGLTLFCFFILIKIPRIQGKAHIAKMIDYKLTRINGKNYFVKVHETFIPKLVFCRRKDGVFYIFHKFKVIDDINLRGVLVRNPETHCAEHYANDEFEYFNRGTMVKGYIHNDLFIVLSIVD